MAKQPTVTCGLRLGPTAKSDLTTLVDALKGEGENPRREDVVGALLRRAQAYVGNPKEMRKLGDDARAHRTRAKAEGF
jgi:hypothetical protein